MRKVRPSPGRFDVSVNIPFDYSLRKAKNPRGLVLLMHGYGQSGLYIFEKLSDYIPEDFTVLSPNAPFPMYMWAEKFPAPGWRDQKVRMGYTWYFYDSKTNEYLVDMQPSLESLREGMKHLELLDLPACVVGFSQGGYVAPFAAQLLKNVKQVIGVSCEFLPDDLEGKLAYRCDAIFGDSDKIASIEAGRNSHSELLKVHNLSGEFHVVAGLDHEVTSAVGKKLQEIGYWNKG